MSAPPGAAARKVRNQGSAQPPPSPYAVPVVSGSGGPKKVTRPIAPKFQPSRQERPAAARGRNLPSTWLDLEALKVRTAVAMDMCEYLQATRCDVSRCAAGHDKRLRHAMKYSDAGAEGVQQVLELLGPSISLILDGQRDLLNTQNTAMKQLNRLCDLVIGQELKFVGERGSQAAAASASVARTSLRRPVHPRPRSAATPAARSSGGRGAATTSPATATAVRPPTAASAAAAPRAVRRSSQPAAEEAQPQPPRDAAGASRGEASDSGGEDAGFEDEGEDEEGAEEGPTAEGEEAAVEEPCEEPCSEMDDEEEEGVAQHSPHFYGRRGCGLDGALRLSCGGGSDGGW